MKRFLSLFLRFKVDAKSTKVENSRTNKMDKSAHEGFKTKPGQGPFLLSPDGRVIPLRKARFLQKH